MAHRIDDNSLQLTSETSNKAALAIRFMIEDIHRKSTPKTPMKTGQLRADVRKNVNKQVNGAKGRITWGKRYAYYQERGYTSGPVKNYTTPGTGAQFAQNAVKDVVKDSRAYFKRAGLL